MNYSSMRPLFDLVQLAYRLLKQDSYYKKMDLLLCVNIAAYEASDLYQKRQDILASIVEQVEKTKNACILRRNGQSL